MKLRNGKYYLTLTGEVGGVTRARARELLLMFNVKIMKNGRWEVRIDFVELFKWRRYSEKFVVTKLGINGGCHGHCRSLSLSPVTGLSV